MIGIITRTTRTVSRPFSRTPWVSWYCKLSDKSHYHWSALTVIVQKYKLVNLCWFLSYLHTTWDRRYVTDTTKWIIFYWNVVIVEFYGAVICNYFLRGDDSSCSSSSSFWTLTSPWISNWWSSHHSITACFRIVCVRLSVKRVL